MSKELEALNILRDNHIQFTRERYEKLDKETLQNIINRKLARWDILELALKRNEPMKVDLKTKYALPYSGTYYKCPKCNQYNPCSARYCMKCGQALDWSESKGERK